MGGDLVMAIAGKIMLRPMGEYDPTYVYDILDMVTYNKCLWISRKPNMVGIEPNEANAEYWQLAISEVTTRITEEQIDTLEPIEAIETDGEPISEEEIDDIVES